MCLALGYQYLLSVHGLREFILTGSDGQGSRVGMLNANREGIFSCIGYLAIYFAGVQVGQFLQKSRWVLYLQTGYECLISGGVDQQL